VPPRAEHLDDRREDEVERDAGDRDPEDRLAQPAAGLGLDLDLGALLDRMLDPVAEGLGRPVGGR
jgi:hypothetical protein